MVWGFGVYVCKMGVIIVLIFWGYCEGQRSDSLNCVWWVGKNVGYCWYYFVWVSVV